MSATYWEMLPAFLVGGVGMAFTMTPGTAAAMRAVPVDRAGVGSAVLNSARQVGGSLGIAAHGRDPGARVGDRKLPNGAPTPEAFVDGFSAALVVASIIAFAGAVVAAVLVRHEVHEETHRVPPLAEPEPAR